MQPRPGRLILRADAGPTIGAGHAVRCLAIAQAWRRRGGEATLVAGQMPDTLRSRLTRSGVSVSLLGDVSPSEDAERTAAAAIEAGAAWVVTDGYAFGDDYRRRLTPAGLRVMALNDFEPIAHADALVNANPRATTNDYADLAEETTLLLGPRYCLLREEFTVPQEPRLWAAPARRVLIAAGGADPTGLSLDALAAIETLCQRDHSPEVTVIVGGANPRRGEIESAAARLPRPARVMVDAADVLTELRRADLAITAAGGFCWEMAYAGLPMLAVATADNQAPVAEAIAASGAGVDLGRHPGLRVDTLAEAVEEELNAGAERRRAMSLAGQRLIDGRGADRVAALMATPAVRFRPAVMTDARLLWEWRHDPVVQRVSLSPGETPFADHCDWLRERLGRDDCLLLLAFDDSGTPYGQARFDGLGEEATAVISVSLSSKSRGRGLGSAVIRRATEHVLGRRLAAEVEAVIKPDNHASRRAFVNAGYQPTDDPGVPGAPLRYTTARPAAGLLQPERAVA